MSGARWLAFGVGAALGVLGGCFFPVQLTGPYHCDEGDQCPGDAGLSCVNGLCCKEDGGSPRCPQRDGPDGGCTLPSDLNCPTGRPGRCDAGTWSCAGGVDMPTCEQRFPSETESCNGIDDDCDGVTDPFPRCGGPQSFLRPDAAYVVDAIRVVGSFPFAPSCLKDSPTVTVDLAETYDGTRWSALGMPGPGDGGPSDDGGINPRTHVAYAEAADGGSWDLSNPKLELRLQLSGFLYNAHPQPFAPYLQPVVLLCSKGGGTKRFNPNGTGLVTNGNTFTLNASMNLLDAGAQWFWTDMGFNSAEVERVEVLLELFPKRTGGAAGFDAGFAVFGFFTR